MVRVEEPGFESRYRQVGGSVYIHSPCLNLSNCVRMLLLTRTCQRGRVNQQHKQAKHYKAMDPSPQRHGKCPRRRP